MKGPGRMSEHLVGWALVGPTLGSSAQVGAHASEAGFTGLDLTSTFLLKWAGWRPWWAGPYGAHPNAATADVAARALLEHLQEHGWIRSGPSDLAGRDGQHDPELPESVEPSPPPVRR